MQINGKKLRSLENNASFNCAFLLLGGNAPETDKLFEKTIELLQREDHVVERQSAIYLSPAWGYDSKNVYKNKALQVRTRLSADGLLDLVLGIERELGRIRSNAVHYEDRPIDIDILLMEDLVIDSDHLEIPHPRLQDRRFALLPLSEIAPDYQHPKLKKTILQLLESCTDLSKVEIDG